VRRLNWQEINNMFCYDVKFPDRLSKKQQILRLYKNSMRRVYDLEMTGEKMLDVAGYAEGISDIRKDFDKLKTAKSVTEVEDCQDKYEDFIEKTYQPMPLIRDNVLYEWRHGKGLHSFESDELEWDPHGYYSPEKLDLYPKPREFEFREDFPLGQQVNLDPYSHNGWETVSTSDYDVKHENSELKTPEQLKSYVDELKQKINKNH
jgi:hypothetical protein